MTRSLPSFLLAAALALFGTGCARDCEDLCEDTKECVGADKSIDCPKNCDEVRQLNEDAGCEDLYDEYLSCTSDSQDVCTVGDSCETEANKWNRCLVDYCSKEENVADCQ